MIYYTNTSNVLKQIFYIFVSGTTKRWKDDMSWFQNTINKMVWVFSIKQKILRFSDFVSWEAGILICDVLLGSILGQILFFIYIKDLLNHYQIAA